MASTFSNCDSNFPSPHCRSNRFRRSCCRSLGGGAVSVIPVCAVLAAAIRMHEDTAGSMPSKHRHPQRIAHQCRRHALGHRPADHRTRVQIHHHGQIQPAFIGGSADPPGRSAARDYLPRAANVWSSSSPYTCRRLWRADLAGPCSGPLDDDPRWGSALSIAAPHAASPRDPFPLQTPLSPSRPTHLEPARWAKPRGRTRRSSRLQILQAHRTSSARKNGFQAFESSRTSLGYFGKVRCRLF